MGKSIKLPKIEAPKVTWDVEKTAKQAVELSLKPVTVPTEVALKEGSKLLAQPGSAELLTGVGAAFGVPVTGLGTSAIDNQAQKYAERKADFTEQTSPMPQTQNFQGGSNNMIIYIVGGLIAVVALVFALKRK